MKKGFFILLILALLAFGQFSTAQAAATTLSWVVSVTYQNVGTGPTSVSVDFYPEGNATPINFDPLSGGTLAAGAGASFYIGSVGGLSAGFNGNAVMASSQPLVATVVEFHQNAAGETVKMRMLSNGFQASDASNQYLIATTLLNKFNRTTLFSIQNTTGSAVSATVKFYDADNSGALAATVTHSIPANSSKYIDMAIPADTNLPGGTTTFNGSAIITVPSGTIVSSVSELYNNRNVGANFEGIPLSRVANTIYMATGLCESASLDTYYAVQNASLTNSASITVTYRNTNGTTKTTDGPYTIGPGQKKSITTCAPSSGVNMHGYTGAASVVSVGAPIAVIGKAQCSVAAGQCSADKVDVFTIFLGESAGASNLALPFVRWANDANYNAASNLGGKQRTYLAIQNLEATTSAVDVQYYDKTGTLCGTDHLSIPALAKGNSNASVPAGVLGCGTMNAGEFGYYTDGSFGGSVLVKAGAANPTAKIIAIARVQNPGAGEDYNAVPVP